jgi:hypothetical protein
MSAFRLNVAVLAEVEAPEFEKEFLALDEALAYATGDDDGQLARETLPVAVEECAAGRQAGVIITARGRQSERSGVDPAR